MILPIKTVSEQNKREHWAKANRRHRAQHDAAYLHAKAAGTQALRTFPATISMTRIAPCRLDSDNLAYACKWVRDGLAKALEIDDGDERVTWTYDQRKGAPREYAVEIQVTHG